MLALHMSHCHFCQAEQKRLAVERHERDEHRLQSLYEEAIAALEGELNTTEAVRNELMKTHMAVVKLHTWVELLDETRDPKGYP